MSGPRTALLIPHYNASQGLYRSLSSIGVQECVDVVVVDDGSTDDPINTSTAEKSFCGQGRVHFIHLARNRGIEHALNRGLLWVADRDYEFVARLDCGDRNVPQRIARQEAFMDANPSVVVVGGAARYVDMQGEELHVAWMPQEHEEILRRMRVNSAFIHPTVLMRTAALAEVGPYPTAFPAAEDYAWFWRFAEIGRLANIGEVLIDYEVNPNGISNSRRRVQIKSRLAIQVLHTDGSLLSFWGILRSAMLAGTPDGSAARLRSLVSGLKAHWTLGHRRPRHRAG